CRALRSRIVICMLTALRLRLTSVTTLFPFTTLFRSREHPVPRGRQRDGLGRLSRGGPALLGCTACPVLACPQSTSNPPRAPEAAGACGRRRWSRRRRGTAAVREAPRPGGAQAVPAMVCRRVGSASGASRVLIAEDGRPAVGDPNVKSPRPRPAEGS